MPLNKGRENVILSCTVGVYAEVEGRGRGPWIETTRRVDGEDVSMYADPGAVVIRPVRMTIPCVRSGNEKGGTKFPCLEGGSGAFGKWCRGSI
jgi:hypothetical protein